MVSTSELRGGSEIGKSICYNKSWGKQLYRQICRELQWSLDSDTHYRVRY